MIRPNGVIHVSSVTPLKWREVNVSEMFLRISLLLGYHKLLPLWIWVATETLRDSGASALWTQVSYGGDMSFRLFQRGAISHLALYLR